MPKVEDAAVQLDWANKDGTVTVTPRDQDRYALKVHQAIELLRVAGEQSKFEAELQILLKKLATWLSLQSGIDTAFVTVRDGGLLFVVVRDNAECDDEFEDSLTDVDIDIANDPDLNRIRLDVLSLPKASPCALDTFRDSSFVISYSRDDS